MRCAAWVAVVVSVAAALLGVASFAQDAGRPVRNSLPVGTILPVRLDSSITSKAKAGQTIRARLMQNVPLPDQGRIRSGARVTGQIISVDAGAPGSGARISFRFDTLTVSGWHSTITVDLRALASTVDVEDAGVPSVGPDRGTSVEAYTTVQVGGDVVYRGGGHVMRDKEIVGEPVSDGVLVRVSANPERGCRGALDERQWPQALWVFSSDACGVYGFRELKIAESGRETPLGQITIAAENGNVNIRAGSGMLLRVVGGRE